MIECIITLCALIMYFIKYEIEKISKPTNEWKDAVNHQVRMTKNIQSNIQEYL